MATTLNYILEANIALVTMLTFYLLFLRRETNFKLMRMLLLAGIFSSLLFPFIHLENTPGIPSFSIGQMIPSYWLPEVVIGGDATENIHEASFNFWKYTTLIYGVGLMLGGLMVSIQLSQLFRIIYKSKTYRLEKLRIAESCEDKPTFSFFYFIFIGKADQLSASEKQQVIQHESVHARQWHSFDMLLINFIKILFWFNPFINTYKKIFIQLHEFEADARAVENSEVNKYCSLLAKVALQSADFTLANHFNHSLTLKRIEMMRTIKTNIKRWKLVALAMMLPAMFFFIACQDQVENDLKQITQNSSYALVVPDAVQSRFEQLQKENPGKQYSVLELNETASDKLQKMEAEYGLPNYIEVFNTAEEETGGGPAMNQLKILSKSNESSYSEIRVSKAETKVAGHSFAIIEFNEQTSKLAEAAHEGDVYTVVEEQPEFNGGLDAMRNFIMGNMRYPLEARQQGIEGTVFVSFIVEKDGAMSETKIIKGISPQCDAEALRVVELFPPWVPGKQRGEAVRVRFVLPIKYKL